jgi:hypothetical protein
MSQGGFGLVVEIGSTPTALVGVRDADFPAFMKFISESTAHDSAQGYYEAVATGKRKLESMQITLIWDQAQATHQTVLTEFASDDPTDFTIADPDGDETLSFQAHIERVSRISRQEDTYIANVDLHPTGPATIT